MSAKHAILGLVIERPGYGYDLARRLQERCAIWGWEPSGVYSALNQLERDELVRSSGKKRSGSTRRGAPRVIYEATADGRGFFRDWIFEPTPLSPVRQELDLKISVAGPEFLARLIDQTWAQERQCIDELRALTGDMKAAGVGSLETWRDAAATLQRDLEMRTMRVRIQWLQDTRQVMQQILERSGGRRPR